MHHSRLKSMGVLCFGGFLLCCFVFVNNSFAHSINRMATSVASAKSQRQLLQDTSLMPGIPIGEDTAVQSSLNSIYFFFERTHFKIK